MILKTAIEHIEGEKSIFVQDKIVSVGSCFSEMIGYKLRQHKFDCFSNPFGTCYNPISVTSLLTSCIDSIEPEPSRIVQRDEIFYHLDIHSQIAALSGEELLGQISKIQTEVKEKLIKADYFILTLGTAIIHRYINDKKIVANCHKLSADNFTKEVLKPQIILSELERLFQRLTSLNPSMRIIMTVSPIRHIKDGLTQNSYSKSILRFVCEELTQSYDHVYYFPSYEIMIDELRDYRFYKDDLIHPSPLAENHIWDTFKSVWFHPTTEAIMHKWVKILSALNHRPFHAGTKAHQKFIRKTISQLEELSQDVDVDHEIGILRNQLT